MSEGSPAAYPRPHLVRTEWVDLRGEWDFAYDDTYVGLVQGWHTQSQYFDRRIQVPFPPESPASGIGDIYGVHDYSFDGATLRARYSTEEALQHTLHRVQPHARWVVARGHRFDSQAVMITEYGGISFRPAAEESWYGYGTVADPESYLAKYREPTEAILDNPVIAGFCYTQLTDTGQETNGLLTADRRPTLEPAAIRAITVRQAASTPGDITVQLQLTRGTGVADDDHSGGFENALMP